LPVSSALCGTELSCSQCAATAAVCEPESSQGLRSRPAGHRARVSPDGVMGRRGAPGRLARASGSHVYEMVDSAAGAWAACVADAAVGAAGEGGGGLFTQGMNTSTGSGRSARVGGLFTQGMNTSTGSPLRDEAGAEIRASPLRLTRAAGARRHGWFTSASSTARDGVITDRPPEAHAAGEKSSDRHAK
jgi:hypothetical protein